MMRSSMMILVLAGAPLVFGCSMVEKIMPGPTLSSANVLSILNTIDRSEIEAGELAKQKAASKEVQSFASRMVSDHTMMMQETFRLSRRINVQPEPPQLAAALQKTHQTAMDELRGKTGRDFDKAYIDYQIAMHEQAIRLVHDTTGSVNHSRLQEHLRQTRPDLVSHLSSARTVEKQLVAQR
ncbi:MAG TPA: DUF4142 domain-containing protein [Nitrospira sp.]|nr:DUF4142 domain-containing protein [Nitrospira sp.]